MKCFGCGFNMTVEDVPASHRCNSCGGTFSFDSDDFLLRQYGAPGRDVRAGQVEMGRLVEKVMREQSIAFIEAPVGSGKSDAYGVPAINAASKAAVANFSLKGRLPKMLAEKKNQHPRIVISTAKKNLQHQIAEKDLPFIRRRHGELDIGIALLKGKSNYACRLKADTVLKPEDAKQFSNWVEDSPGEDLSDFPGRRPPFLMDVTAEDCVGKNCKYAYAPKGEQPVCGYWRAKQNAKHASVIVTNHHVVAFDLRFGPGVIIGPYTTLIIDEAHQAPSSFRAAFSNSVAQNTSNRLVRQIDSAGMNGWATPLRDGWKDMFKHLEDTDGEIPKDPFGAEGVKMQDFFSHLGDATLREAYELGYSADEDFDIHNIADEGTRAQLMAVMALKKSLDRVTPVLLTARAPSDNTVLYVVTNEKGQKKLVTAPISVGKVVGPKLQLIPAVVLTSATMAIGGRFDDIKSQMGLNWASYSDETGATHDSKQIHELILGSPFNYDKQALLYTPRHIPNPVSAGDTPERVQYISALVMECARLIRASKGNAFILFTANKDLKEVYDGLVEDGVGDEFPLITQEEDAAVTLKQYMATPNSVLLGVKSFWEGVDVQGQKLQLVVITKLPFPMLTDPVLQARSRQIVAEQVARGVNPQTAQSGVFSQLQIPHMLTELRQGAGRLIRSKTDRGVLAILDARMFTGNSKDRPRPDQMEYRGYGKQAADATGFNNRVHDFEVILRVFTQWNERNAAKKKSSPAP